MNRFLALDLSYSVIREVRSPLDSVRRRSERLARQIEDAASSVSLNLGEGQRRQGKDRLHHYRVAAGSADEVRCGLRVAEAWGYVAMADIEKCLQVLDRLLGMLWSLTQGRRNPARGTSRLQA